MYSRQIMGSPKRALALTQPKSLPKWCRISLMVGPPNVLARQQNAEVLVVDIGVNHKFSQHPELLDRKIALGTRNLAKEPAMTRTEAEEAITIGIQIAAQLADKGVDLLATGEMGIGNTTASSAIFSVLSGLPANKVTGRGTGIDDKTLEKRYL